MSESQYNSTNFLTASQRRLFKKLDGFEDGRAILTSKEIKGSEYFVSAGSLTGLNSKAAKLKKLLDDALELTKLLMNDKLYNEKNKEETADLRKSVSDLIDDVKTHIDSGLDGKLTSSTLRTFAFNLNSKFALKENETADEGIKKMVTYGVFANVYKKIIGLLKNYNPESRTKPDSTRQGLGEMATDNPSEPYVESVLSKTIKDKGSDHQWILNHINTSLPICCIDKLICITNDSSKIHTLIGEYVKKTDKLNDVVGGTPLSFFSYISFYYATTGTIDSAKKLRPKIAKSKTGWLVRGVLYPERLNLQNEIRRSKKSITTDENRAYEVYLIKGGLVKKVDDEATSLIGNMGYTTIYSETNPLVVGKIDNN